MSRYKEHVGKLLFLGLMVFCFSAGILLADSREKVQEVYMLYYADEPFDSASAFQIQRQNEEEEEPFRFTLWQSESQRLVSYDSLGKSLSSELITICGSSELLFESENTLFRDDSSGCLVSPDVCYRLTGNYNFTGKSITIGEKEYTIRGLLEGIEESVVIQAEESSETLLDTVALEITDGKAAAPLVEKFSAKYGPADREFDMSLYKKWGRTFLSLLPLLMTVIVIFPVFIKAWKWRKNTVLSAAVFLGGIIIALVCLWIMEVRIPVLQYISPTKWSDFTYWSRFSQQVKTDGEMLFFGTKRAPERIEAEYFMRIFKYACVCIAAFFIGVKNILCKNLYQLYFHIGLSFMVSFFCIWLFEKSGIRYMGSRSIWLTGALFLTVKSLWNSTPDTLNK